MTLMELMVAVFVLILVMMSFGMIMAQIQRTVSTGQKAIRVNSAATAIVEATRTDLRRASRQGFLCITQIDDGDGSDGFPPLLTFTTAGVTQSRTSSAIANAAIVAIGMCDNAAPSADFNPSVLYCQRWLLTGTGIGAGDQGMGLFSMAMLQTYPRSGAAPSLDILASTICTFSPTSFAPVNLPPASPTEVGALWQVLSDNCEWASVMWTDGAVDATTNLPRWYGVDYDPDPDNDPATPGGVHLVTDRFGGSGWTSRTIANDPNQIDYNAGAGVDLYRALWTNDNQSNWPAAVKIRYRIVDPDADGDDDDASTTYEVVCPLGG
jgi:hypothetical protein